MTNSHTKILFTALSLLLLVFSGCKKEKNESSTFTLEQTTIDFEWGQTKEVGFTSKNMSSFSEPVVPSGGSCQRIGNKYVITSPREGAGAVSGKIELPGVANGNVPLRRVVNVAVRIAEEITAGANCIIISEPGKRFKFDASKRGNETSASIEGATAGKLLWTTSTDAVSRVSLENGYLYFATGEGETLTEGNAVVTVVDKDDNSLWSWHIWVTNYDPSVGIHHMNDYRVMNRNLGAFANSGATPEEVVRSYGLYYQWGRKDPFVGPVEWDSTTPMPLYVAEGYTGTYTFVASDSETGTVEYAIANPGTFIAGRSETFDWLDFPNDQLWESPSGAKKTIYDPCPAGWRVAPADIWKDFTTTGNASSDAAEFNVEGDYMYGWTFNIEGTEGDIIFNNNVFFPAAGRRSFSPSLATSSTNFTNVVNDDLGVGYPVGFYWSSTPGVRSSLAFRHDYINPGASVDELSETARAGAFPLRCVAE